jgi:hypothetical protein
MKLHRALLTVLISVSAVLYGFSAFETTDGDFFSINVDASRPLTIEWPCEVAIVGDGGEKGLRIGANIGRGWRGEAGGQAVYKFYVPRDGAYHIWAYALWFDQCANAVFAQIDDSQKAILGNDPVYGQWHWVRGFQTELRQGSHTLVLSNHSDHVSIRKVLLTNASTIAPGRYDLVFSNLFYDGFDGCDHGNFSSWKQVTGQWTILNLKPDEYNPENALLGRSQSRASIMYENETWKDYSLNVSLRFVHTADPNATVGIRFGVQDIDRFYQLSWRADEMKLMRKNGGETITLGTFGVPHSDGIWHDVEITAEANKVMVTVNDLKPFVISIEDTISGGIGFCLEGDLEAHFDNIHVRQREGPG